MKPISALATVVALCASHGALALQDETPGVTQVAPGVTQIDGAKVPSTTVTAAKLEAAIAEDNRFKKVKELFKVKGIQSPGPQGTTTYMYKVLDPDTEQNMAVVLFVKDKKVVEHLIM